MESNCRNRDHQYSGFPWLRNALSPTKFMLWTSMLFESNSIDYSSSSIMNFDQTVNNQDEYINDHA